MRKRRAILLFSSMLLLYPLSYVALSRKGRYECGHWGLIQGKGDYAVLAPKIEYAWNPFAEASSEIAEVGKIFYKPLAAADRKLWHQDYDPFEGKPKYPVGRYFDPETESAYDYP